MIIINNSRVYNHKRRYLGGKLKKKVTGIDYFRRTDKSQTTNNINQQEEVLGPPILFALARKICAHVRATNTVKTNEFFFDDRNIFLTILLYF